MPQRNRIFAVLTFGFVLLGMPFTAMGVAWPSVAEDLGRAISELGVVIVCFGAGYTVSTLATGRIAQRVAIGRLLIAAGATSGFGLAVIASSTRWAVFLVAVALIGVTGGIIDAATNTYIAVRRGPRAMGLIHAGFGIGAIFGPLFITLLLAAGASWRIAYASLAIAQAVSVTALWIVVRTVDARGEDEDAPAGAPLRSPILLWSVLVFLLYAGVAAGTGAWAFTFLTEGRSISEGIAGLVVTGYWTSFTASRFVLGAIGDRMAPNAVLAMSGAAIVAGLAVFWWAPTEAIGLVALIFTGFAHGPVFPLEVLLTPRRFGAKLTATVVGYEIAAANIGGAILPGVIGILVGVIGVSAIPVFLFANSVLLWGAIKMLRIVSDGGVPAVGLTDAGAG